MPDSSASTPEPPRAVAELLVLSVRLVGSSPATSPLLIEAALRDSALIHVIEDELKTQARAMLAAATTEAGRGTVVATSTVRPQGNSLLTAMAGMARSELNATLLDAAKSSPAYQRLESQVKVVDQAFRGSPIGVWLDTTKSLVLIVGVVAAVGSAVGFYLTKTGDSNTPPVEGFGRSIEIGTLNVTPQAATFAATARKQRVGIIGDWKFARLPWSASLCGVLVAGAGSGAAGGSVRYLLNSPVAFSASKSIQSAISDVGLIDPKHRSLHPPLPGGRGQFALGVDYWKDGFRLGVLGHVTPTVSDVNISTGYSRSEGLTSMRFDAASGVANRGATTARSGVPLLNKQSFGVTGAALERSVVPSSGWESLMSIEICG